MLGPATLQSYCSGAAYMGIGIASWCVVLIAIFNVSQGVAGCILGLVRGHKIAATLGACIGGVFLTGAVAEYFNCS